MKPTEIGSDEFAGFIKSCQLLLSVSEKTSLIELKQYTVSNVIHTYKQLIVELLINYFLHNKVNQYAELQMA